MNKIIALLLTLAVLFAGCASNDTDTNTNTKTYTSIKGDVEIPTTPTAIVTDYYVGQLLSIGAPVVGGDLTYSSPAWGDSLEGVTDIGQSTEMVASLNPDLIITFNEEAYPTYSSIAPTIFIPYGMYNEEELVTELGIITGLEENAQNVLNDYNSKIDEIQSIITQPELTYSIIEFAGSDPYIYGNSYGRLGYVIYEKLDLKCTQACEENILTKSDSYLLLTQENIDKYIGDVLILSTPNAEPISNSFTNSESFKTSDAYINQRIYYVDSNLWYFTDMISIMEQMDDFEEIIINGNL